MHLIQPMTTRILLNVWKRKGLDFLRAKVKAPRTSMTTVDPPLSRSSHTVSYHLHRVHVLQESIITPGQMIDLELSVLDTHPHDVHRPIVVGIPGIPGWALDFEPLIEKLMKKEVRFIGPTFPGFQTSEVDPWKLYHLDYSSRGLKSIVEQVLKELEVDRVSMLLCHSAGGWTGYRMAAECDWVHSLCVINPGCARPHRSLRPQWVIHAIARLMRIQSLHFFMMPFLEFAYAWIGFQGVKAGDHLMVCQQIISSQNFEDTQEHVAKIQEKRLPLLFCYSLSDKIIETCVFEEMLYKNLGVPKHQVWTVDFERNQTRVEEEPPNAGEEAPWHAQGLRFERGGHVVHKINSNIILERMMQILSHVEGSPVG